jgi:predicted TIM-barrel fold metal-dependent hydrolase
MKPIIDVHEHIFRGRDIPVKGYLYSRRYTGLAACLARLLRLPSVLARCVRRSQRRVRPGWVCRLLVWFAGAVQGEDYRTWGRILSLGDVKDVADCLLETFKKIDLSVPLMVDYEYWFKNTVDTPLPYQIDLVHRNVVIEHQGRVHPFVPFDPVRELACRKRMRNPDNGWEKDGSLRLVKDAIARKGFIGVKLYNAVGYRPWRNGEVDGQRQALFRRNGMERYASFTGREIDGVLDELYAYCEREQVPITAHCVGDGIECYWGASYDFGKPEYWLPVLERHPKLHLNLAHFGWSDAERYTTGSHSWVRQICEMIKTYPNVYTDVAHHPVVIPKKRAGFLSDYRLILRDYPGVIQRKLLFGIDWHVITRVSGYRNFVRDYLELLRGNGLFTSSEIAGFMGGNALRFLGLLGGARGGWTRNRARLASFYRTNHIRPPRWFVATG